MEDMYWAIGLFEGEGCISIVKSRREVRLRMVSTDLDVLERFREIVGYGSISERKKREEHHKPAWEWYSKGRLKIIATLSLWLPHFSKRRAAKAREALEWLGPNKHLNSHF